MKITTMTDYAEPVKTRGANASEKMAKRIAADISLLVRAALFGALVICGLLLGEIIADMLRADWLAAVISIGLFSWAIWYIVCDLRRVFRAREARRARLAEACGLRAEDLL